jgi:hypothetical protein
MSYYQCSVLTAWQGGFDVRCETKAPLARYNVRRAFLFPGGGLPCDRTHEKVRQQDTQADW